MTKKVTLLDVYMTMNVYSGSWQDGKESVVKEVFPGDSVHSLLSILDVITVGYTHYLHHLCKHRLSQDTVARNHNGSDCISLVSCIYFNKHNIS